MLRLIREYRNADSVEKNFPLRRQRRRSRSSFSRPVYVSAINPAWPKKSKEAAGILAIFLGGLGIHKFYLGKVGMGILYLLFCWTGIPELAGFIEGIIYLCSDDENFQLKHHVRLK